MKERKKVAKKGEKGCTDKATYSPPRLMEFGPVGALTQSGTGSPQESTVGNPKNPMCSGQKTRSRC
jgi:hypothetical protein